MSNPKPPPHNGPEFETMMRTIDAELVAEGRPIESRPLLAGRAISIKYKVPIPLTADWSRLPPDLRPYGPLGAAIHRWYQEIYGDRLKIDVLPGRSVVRLDGDLYVLKIPRMFGSARFVVSRTFLPEPLIQRGPTTCNIVQLVEDLTPAKAMLLTDGALQSLAETFRRALSAVYTMEVTEHDLMAAARGDVSTAISCLMQRDGRFGASKWASLQAAEKVLKAAIALQGATFKFTHNLEELRATLSSAGVALTDPALLNAIQCAPAIRYGETSCSMEEALVAHHASLELVNRLHAAGAKFALGRG